MPDELQTTLDASGLTTDVKARVWDAYHRADSPEKFKTTFDTLSIPTPVKAKLWDLKFPKQVGATAPPASTTPTPPAKSPTPPAKGQFLGDSTKPASIKAQGGTLFESIPQVTGALGGATAATAAAPTGPAGAATAGVAGAGAGGLIGRYTQHLLSKVAGGTGVGDFLGIPPEPAPAPGTHPLIGQLGAEATRQMENEMGGAIIAAPLGFVRRGGFLKFDRDTMATLREDRALGTRLSGPEIASNTRAGKIGKTIQSYAAGAFEGGPMQEEARTQGTKAARDVLDTSINLLLTKPAGKAEAGRAAEAGLGAAKTGQQEVGKLLDAEAEKAPPVDLTAAKQAAVKELETKITPLLSAFPDQANNAKLAATIRKLRSDPSMIQRLPRPELLAVTDAILQKYNSPVMRELRTIIGAEDSSAFKGVWEQSKRLRAASTPEDQLYAKNDVQRVSTMFNGLLRKSMAEASPTFDQVASTYRSGARVLESRATRQILKTAVEKPEAVVDLFKANPTRAAQLQRALKAVAARGPDAARAQAAYDTVRATYLQHTIIQGGKPLPTSEAGFNKMLTGMADRLRAEQQSGVVPQWFSDKNGKAVIQNVERVANLMEKRSPVMAGNLRKIFEIGRIMTAGMGVATGHLSTGTVGAAVLWEGFPDFFIWAVHNPKATKWFIEGVSADNPVVSSAATVRLMELYRQQVIAPKQSQTATSKSATAAPIQQVPPGGAPSPSTTAPANGQ